MKTQPGRILPRPPSAADARRRRNIRGIVTSLAILVGLAVVTLLFHRPTEPEVLSVTLATALDDLFRPIEATEHYDPDATFFASVRLRHYRSDMELWARWSYEGQLITETLLETSDSGEGYAGFALRNDDPPWPSGHYTLEVVYQDRVLGSADFQVEALE